MNKDKGLIIFAFFLVIIIFLLGFLFSNYISSLRLEHFRETQEISLYNIIGLDVSEQIIKDLCSINDSELWKEKVELGRKLTALENKKGKNDKEVLRIKEIYEIIEIKTLILLERIKKECNQSFNIILYFYSNKQNAQACEDQGKILDTIVYEHNEKRNKKGIIYVFAFSIESNNPASRSLRNKYGIKNAPSLVIDGILLDGYQEKQDIERFLDNLS